MANPVALFDAVVARVWCSDDEQASVNTFVYQCIAIAFSDPTDEEIADDLDTLLAPLYKDVLNTATMYNGVQVYLLGTNLNTFPYVPAVSTGGAGLGVVSGNGLPRQSCGITGWTTRKTGPSHRGRTYWPFPPVSFDSGQGVPSAPAIAYYDTIALAVRNYVTTSLTGATMEQQLWHRGHANSTPPIPGTLDAIMGYTTRAKWATQRRRGSFGRANVSPI